MQLLKHIDITLHNLIRYPVHASHFLFLYTHALFNLKYFIHVIMVMISFVRVT